MAIHAAMVDRMDREIGRVLEQLRAMEAFDNTLILFLCDNGASAENLVRGDGHDPAAPPGSAQTFLCLGPGWANLANTPLRRSKILVHEGGISTPLIVHWPRGIAARGELRHPGHLIDLVPTILALTGGSGRPNGKAYADPACPARSLVPTLAKDRPVERVPVVAARRQPGHSRRRLEAGRAQDGPWELYDLATDRGIQEPGRKTPRQGCANSPPAGKH